jgi:hypothetical protein
VASKLFAENGCLKERHGNVWFHLHCRGRGIDCTNAAATSHIQSMMLRIGMLLEEKIERLSVILRSLNMVNYWEPPMLVIQGVAI